MTPISLRLKPASFSVTYQASYDLDLALCYLSDLLPLSLSGLCTVCSLCLWRSSLDTCLQSHLPQVFAQMAPRFKTASAHTTLPCQPLTSWTSLPCFIFLLSIASTIRDIVCCCKYYVYCLSLLECRLCKGRNLSRSWSCLSLSIQYSAWHMKSLSECWMEWNGMEWNSLPGGKT